MNIQVVTKNEIISRTYTQERILLSDVLKDCGLRFDMPCGGIGRCLKCKIKASGALSEMSRTEHMTLTDDEKSQGYRYACLTYATGDAAIYYNTQNAAIQGLTYGFMPDFEKKQRPLQGGGKLGISVDIGTTTIAVHLYDLERFELLHTAIEKSAQIPFGADVISRITASLEGKTKQMHQAIISQIDSMVVSLISEINEDIANIGTAVVTGNTTMLHLFCNIPTQKLSAYPFVPDELFGKQMDAASLGFSFDCSLYLVRSISGFVGADITCGIISSEMMKNKASMLVDIGTNGEIVLHHNGTLLSCSTAAGPAFEGGNISQGSPAVPGAVSRVYAEEDQIKYSVIDDVPASSICGSGIIDVVSVLKYRNILEPSGLLYEGEQKEFLIPDSEINITQQDIRQIQLAKSALISGMLTLIQEAGLVPDDIEVLYLSGGFSMFIDIDSAVNIGLIPAPLKDKIRILGNSSLSGADMILLNPDYIERSEEIAKTARTVSLETSSFFMDAYVSNMEF